MIPVFLVMTVILKKFVMVIVFLVLMKYFLNMRCINPIRIKNPLFPHESSLKYIDCSCRKCFNCLLNIRREWYFRLFYESVYSDGASYFVGLDYRPDCCDMQLHKVHLQKFFKRLRKRGLAFTYYAIGEFGTSDDHTHRPHYHALMFFKAPYTRDFIDLICSDCWPFGRVDVGFVEPASINYVLHYHVRPKSPFGEDDDRKTFAVMSQGLGLGFMDTHLLDVFTLLCGSSSRRVTNQFGQHFVLPRYIVRKYKDYGLPVVEFDGSSIDWTRDSLRDYVELLDSRIEFDSDGRPKQEWIDRWNSLVNDIILDSKRKLDKYVKQDKI